MAANMPPPPDIAFEFVRSLAAELSAGKVDLPSFPEAALRLRRVLSEPTSTTDQVVRLVGSEPALAARLMRIANSASLNRSGKTIGDLRTAINRMGYNMVRSAAIAFAVTQIRDAGKFKGLDRRLKDIWQRSTLVAAFAFVVARSCSRVNPDEALLAGIMHGIGKLYVVTRAAGHPELFAEPATLDGILEGWHASIGKAILENWGFSEELSAAIGEQDNHDRARRAAPELRDVLAVAVVMATHGADCAELATILRDLPTAQRLGLTEDRLRLLLSECAAEIAALAAVLGD
jgi:HD-like signal output (HDOD) protein